MLCSFIRPLACTVRRALSPATILTADSKRGRLLAAAVVLAWSTGAQMANAQTTYSGGGAISIENAVNATTSSGSSTLTVSGAPGSVKTIYVTLSGVNSSGSGFNSGIGCTGFVLESPGGEKFELLGDTGSNDTMSNATITIEDGKSAAPLSNENQDWPSNGGTVEPSSYWSNPDGWCGTTAVPSYFEDDSLPQTDGSATLDNSFAGAGADGTWTLYIYTDDPGQAGGGTTSDPVSITGWSMTMTFNSEESYTTSTSVSSSVSNPGLTTSSYTLTATVTDTGGGPTVSSGTVAFVSNGSTISGCGSVAVSNGTATCTTSFPTQGLYGIVANYTPGSGFYSSSSNTLDQLVEYATTGSTSSNTWCNTDSLAVPGTVTPTAYPSVVKVSGYPDGTTVANVEVELEGLTGYGDAQHLLVAPDGTHNLDFFDQGFDSSFSTSSPVNLNFYDSAGQYTDAGGDSGPTSGNYEATDESQASDTFASSSAPTYDTSIPQVPGTVNYAYDPFSPAAHGPVTATFENNFSGAPANGTWALYTYQSLALDETIGSGWCIVLTLNSGVATTTALASNANPQVAKTPVTLTATVKAGSSPVTNGGTVTFEENGGLPAGVSSPNNVVDLSTTTGTAALTTGTVSSSINIGNSQSMTIYEGDYEFSADYSGVADEDAASDASLWQRFNNATTLSAGSGGSINACNSGPVLLNQGNIGAFAPNPSNIVVAGLPGTIDTVTLTLNGFYTNGAEDIYRTAALIEGPTGAALDFFSNTGDASTVLGGSTSPWGNLTFADAGSTAVPDTGNYSAGTYKPTAYQGSSSTDTFTSSSSGLYNVPGSFAYAQPQGAGTFANTFEGTNGNGTWSLFFNNATEGGAAEGAQSGWCLNFTENPVSIMADENHSGTGTSGDFIQGETGAQITTVVTNNGSGPTGDPLGTNPLTVVDTLNSSLTYTGFTGTGWSCSASGQTVTCTNDSAVAQGSAYPTLTLNVNVSASFSGSFSNSATVSGAGVTSTSSNTDDITVQGSASLSIAKSHTGTFTQGSTGVWTLVVTNNASSGSTSGTVTVSDTLPNGYTLASSSSTGSLFSCSGTGTVTCTGTPGLAANGGSNTIQLTVNIPASSPTSVSNTASVWGGGDPVHTNAGTAAQSNTDMVTVVQVPASIAIVSGNSQSTAAGTAFANALTVKVEDAATNPISGASVTFTAPGSGASASLSNSGSCTTAVNGECSVTATANTVAGAYSVSAQSGSASNSFSLTNTAGAPANFVLTEGSGQAAYVQTGFSVPLAVQVTDATNNPISGLTISFTAPGSGASAALSSSGSCTTAANGSCSVTATANDTAGGYSVTASVSGYSGLGTLSFELTNNPQPSYVVNTIIDDVTGTASNCPNGGATTPACTLRDALAAAASAGTGNITFSSTVFNTAQTITLTSGALTIPPYTGITGPGASLLTVSGNSASRVFSVGSGVKASISNLTIADGVDNSGSSGGGGIYNGGTLSLSSCAVTGNQQTNSGWGAGILNDSGANLTINQCTFSNNTAAGNAGQGGGLFNSGTATITNSTFSANTGAGGLLAGGQGGAINNNNGATLTLIDSTLSGNQITDPDGSGLAQGGAIFNLGALTVENSTIAGNHQVNSGPGDTGGGIVTSSGTGRSCTLSNSILAGNTDTGGNPDGVGPFSDGGGDLIGNGTGISGISNGTNGDQIGTSVSPINAQLAALGNYGGPTQTMIPLPGSAAICAISPSSASGTDQRGLPATTTYGTTTCQDLGAVETNYSIQFTANPPASVDAGANFTAAVTLDESGAPVSLSGVTIPLTLNATAGTLSGGSASTANGVASYTALQVNAGGTGDTLTANLLVTAASAAAQETLSATSGSFDVTELAPTISMSFSPSTVLASGTSTLTVTLGNPNTALTLTNVQMSTTLPSGLTPLSPNALTCTLAEMSGSGLRNLGIDESSLAPGQSCTSTFQVQASAASPAVYTDTAQVTATQWTGTAPTTTATLTVDSPATHFSVTAPATATGGTPLNFTVTALDATNATVTLYSGTVHFTSSDPNAVLPADTTLTNGTGTLSATLKTPGNQTVTATDTVSSTVTGTSSAIAVSAPSFVVTNTNDSGSGSLRDALASAASAGSGNITFDPTAFSASNTAAQNTIALASGLTIPANTTITGPTTGSGASLANLVTVSGGGSSSNFSIFKVDSGVTGDAIANLTISNGYVTSQGGAINLAGSLAVTDCTFANNTALGYATGGDGNGGGAIFMNTNAGTLTIVGSTFTGNKSAPGGAMTIAAGNVTISDSTFYGNAILTNLQGGGAIYVGTDGPPTVTITNSTFSGNIAASSEFGGLLNNGTLHVSNSIFAGDTGGECTGSGCPTNGANGNIVDVTGVAANLSALGNYGGSTQTMIPLPASSAICAGLAANIPNGLTTDQRGEPNTNTTYPGYSAGSPCVDAGAVQTDYSIGFTVQPSTAPADTAISPAPTVTLDESGAPFTAAAITIPLTLTSNPSGATLSGGSASTSAGVATYSSLEVNSPGTGDTLAATLALDASPAVSISAQSGGFNVGQATPTASFVPSPASQTYGTAVAAGSLDATAAYNSASVAGTFAYTTTVNGSPVTLVAGTTVLPAGTYTVTATFTPNDPTVYKGTSITASYTVNPAALTVTASSATMTYGGTVPTITPGYSGFVNGDTSASLSTQPTCSTTATSQSPVGSYPSSCSGAVDPNYTIGYTAGSVAVGQAALTITASSGTMTYGGTVPTITPSYAGFVNGDTSASLTTQPTCSTTATSHSAVGSYPSSCTGAVDANYTIGYTAGSVAVGQVALTITASNATKTYGTANPTFTGTVTGAVNGDTFSESFSTTATLSSSVGAYAIVPSASGADLSDYAQTIVDGTLTVTQAASITTIGLSSASITPGQSETITVTVASATTGTPTGTVQIYDGTTLVTTLPLTNGSATYTTATLAPGVTHVISAVYSGDSNFTGSTSSSTASVTVAPLDFTMAISGPSIATVMPGQSISYRVTVSPLYGSYAGTVNFAVTGLPQGATATFSPSTIAANGGPQTITVTITAPPAVASNHPPTVPTTAGRAAPLALAFLLLFGMGAVRRRGRSARRLLAIVLLLVGGAAATLVSGCGGGFFAQAPQNYNVTVSATAGTLEHSVNVTLNVE